MITIPPLLLAVVLAGLMLLIDTSFGSFSSLTIGRFLSGILGIAAILFLVAGVGYFRKFDTTVNPMTPEQASVLVTTGVYSITRNPMYLSFALALLGWGVFLANLLSLGLVVVFVIYMDRVQIPREEIALEKLFGEEYLNYKRAVRRWL